MKNGWPSEVKIMGHKLPVWDAVEVETRTANIEWYQQAVAIDLLQVPEPPKRAVWERFFGDGRRYFAWERKRDYIDDTNRIMLSEAKDALTEQLAFICKCPREAVLTYVQDDPHDPLGTGMIVRAKAPCVVAEQ